MPRSSIAAALAASEVALREIDESGLLLRPDLSNVDIWLDDELEPARLVVQNMLANGHITNEKAGDVLEEFTPMGVVNSYHRNN